RRGRARSATTARRPRRTGRPARRDTTLPTRATAEAVVTADRDGLPAGSARRTHLPGRAAVQPIDALAFAWDTARAHPGPDSHPVAIRKARTAPHGPMTHSGQG